MTDQHEQDGPAPSSEPPDEALPPAEPPVTPPYEPHLELEPASEPALDPDQLDDEPLPLPLAARVVSTSSAPVASAIPMLAGRRQFARTTPVVVDRGRATIGFPTLGDRRQLGQVGLVVLMIAALGALLVARGPDTSGLGRAASPTPHGSIAASPKTSPRPSATPTLGPGTSVSPVPVSPTPSPTARPQTYTVKSGDTLSRIAVRFHTTAKIIEQLNGIKSPFVIHPGEILKLP